MNTHSTKIVLICSTPRSGSSLLSLSTSLLPGTFGGKEYFNEDAGFISSRSESQARNYIDNLISKHPRTRLLCIKLHINDFQKYLANGIDLIDMINPDFFIYIHRLDVIDQAISLKIAYDENSWIHMQERDGISTYDFNAIKYSTIKINKLNQLWNNIFIERNISYLEVRYEDFIKGYHSTLKRIGSYLEIPNNFNYNEIKPPIKKQGDQRNIEWKMRYLEDNKNVPLIRQLKFKISELFLIK